MNNFSYYLFVVVLSAPEEKYSSGSFTKTIILSIFIPLGFVLVFSIVACVVAVQRQNRNSNSCSHIVYQTTSGTVDMQTGIRHLHIPFFIFKVKLILSQTIYCRRWKTKRIDWSFSRPYFLYAKYMYFYLSFVYYLRCVFSYCPSAFSGAHAGYTVKPAYYRSGNIVLVLSVRNWFPRYLSTSNDRMSMKLCGKLQYWDDMRISFSCSCQLGVIAPD